MHLVSVLVVFLTDVMVRCGVLGFAGKKFLAEGVQIAAGVPLQCDEVSGL